MQVKFSVTLKTLLKEKKLKFFCLMHSYLKSLVLNITPRTQLSSEIYPMFLPVSFTENHWKKKDGCIWCIFVCGIIVIYIIFDSMSTHALMGSK